MTDEEEKEIHLQIIRDVEYAFFLENFNNCIKTTEFMCEMQGIPHKKILLFTADNWVEGCRKARELEEGKK